MEKMKSIQCDGRMFPHSLLYCEGRHRPILRGILHLFGALFGVPAIVTTTAPHLDNPIEEIALVVLICGTLCSWGYSALFHCGSWKAQQEISAQRLDHAAVFVNIGCTYTAVAVMLSGIMMKEAPDGASAIELLWPQLLCVVVLWMSCGYGIWHVYNRFAQRMVYWVGSVFLTIPSFPYLSGYMTLMERSIALLGLFSYAVGAFIFGRQICDIAPALFGYHEVFHLLTLLSGFAAFYLLLLLSQRAEQRCEVSNNSLLTATVLQSVSQRWTQDFCNVETSPSS